MTADHAATDLPQYLINNKVPAGYFDTEILVPMVEAASRINPKVVGALHLDHGNEEHAFDTIASGKYSSVIIDFSHGGLI